MCYYRIVKIDGRVNTISDWFDNLDDAIAEANSEWDCLTGNDQKRREDFYVGTFESKEDEAECIEIPYIIKLKGKEWHDMYLGALDENGEVKVNEWTDEAILEENAFLGRFSNGLDAAKKSTSGWV